MTRTLSFSPLFGSSVGFDRFDDLFDSLLRASEETEGQPPYDIERDGDEYTVTMAVAGFAESDLNITVRNNDLVVAGERKAQESADAQYLFKGIALRNFQRTFRLADYVVVKAAELKDGLLRIYLAREVPEDQKPRRIEIRSKSEFKAIEGSAQKVA